MNISPARTAAYDILLKIETEKAFSSTLLPLYESDLSGPDRGLCHELVLGVLRRQIKLDRLVDQFVGGRKLDLEVRIILRLGLFQICYLDRVPAHAAVNESVGLAVRAKKTSAKGLVNAVLRKAGRGIPSLVYIDELDRISVETSHPRWLLERWSIEFGKHEAERLAVANNEIPQLAFRTTPKVRDLDLKDHYASSTVVKGCYFADAFDDELRLLSVQGEIYFQDEASQLVADAVEITEGQSFLDVCASPGGKTTAVISRRFENQIRDQSIFFVAGDLTSRRVRLLRETCLAQAAGIVKIVQYDAAVPLPFAEGQFDSVLVDAPCTGTGTIRHNPEIRYFLSPDDLQRMKDIQISILRNAAAMVKPGGSLVYSTCSLEHEENEAVCEQFLVRGKEFTALKPNVPERFITADGFARTFPHKDKMDGFFIASFDRKPLN